MAWFVRTLFSGRSRVAAGAVEHVFGGVTDAGRVTDPGRRDGGRKATGRVHPLDEGGAGEGAHAKGGSAEVAHMVPDSPQAERLGGIAEKLARQIERETGWDSRHVVLGHLQRARPPTTTDRFLTVAMGVEAARMVEEGAWDQAVVYRKGTVCRAPITDLMQPARLIPDNHRWLRMAQALGIFV